ncbi:MAG: nodulation protein nolNO [Gammaproteobacteria bacterium SHHR-1]
MRYYLGIANSFHDSALAIVDPQGKLLFAEGTERYLQNKRAVNNSPDQFHRMEQILAEHVPPGAELVVAHSWSDQPAIGQLERDAFANLESSLSDLPEEATPQSLLDLVTLSKLCDESFAAYTKLTGINLRYGLSQMPMDQRLKIAQLRKFNHHSTHAATACYSSPFSQAACAVLDGYGERTANSSFVFRNNQLTLLPGQEQGLGMNFSSLGSFYMTLCKLCGFALFNGEEWKMMGLAAYGKLDPEIYALLKPLVMVDGLNIRQEDYRKSFLLYQELEKYRHRPGQPYLEMADVAFTAQQVFSEAVFSYLTNLHELTGMDAVVLGGGCFLNSSTNGQIIDNTPFKQAYLFSAPGDDGNAAGAAWLAYYQDHPEAQHSHGFQSPYLGSKIDPKQLKKLRNYGPPGKVREAKGEVSYIAAERLAEGKIIGWMQGRAEFGPRALGNRSILADPRSAEVKERINDQVKFREAFRPFAPSILHEHGAEYFEGYQETPYMERTLRFRASVRDKVPGVVHVDGTGRLQSVTRAWNPRYYDLIAAFYEITGIPLVLNTSFNVMGKPIIHSLEDALAVFYTSGLDLLIIGDTIIEK